MADRATNAALNDVLILVYRSLLQYSNDCWPWVNEADEPEHRAIEDLANEQQAIAVRMAEFLDRRGWPVDFGVFPNWSDLHYVSVEYLLGKLIVDETEMIDSLEQSAPAFQADLEAKSLVTELLAGERRRLARLREIAAAPKPAAPA